MTAFVLKNTGIATTVFLVLYIFYVIFATYIVVKRGFKTIFTNLFVFGLLRLAGQACGVAFAVNGFASPSASNLLIAYMVLGAQGFLALIHGVIGATSHELVLEKGESWFDTFRFPVVSRIKLCRSPYDITRWILSAGSIVLIIGAIDMSNVDTASNVQQAVNQARTLRLVGLILILVGALIALVFAFYTFFGTGITTIPMGLVLCVSPFFLVRVIYNFLILYVAKMDMFNFNNYTSNGADALLVIVENVLSVAMEFIACILLTIAFLYSRPMPRVIESDRNVSDDDRKYLA